MNKRGEDNRSLTTMEAFLTWSSRSSSSGPLFAGSERFAWVNQSEFRGRKPSLRVMNKSMMNIHKREVVVRVRLSLNLC